MFRLGRTGGAALTYAGGLGVALSGKTYRVAAYLHEGLRSTHGGLLAPNLLWIVVISAPDGDKAIL
jgi:hypothetical protein